MFKSPLNEDKPPADSLVEEEFIEEIKNPMRHIKNFKEEKRVIRMFNDEGGALFFHCFSQIISGIQQQPFKIEWKIFSLTFC